MGEFGQVMILLSHVNSQKEGVRRLRRVLKFQLSGRTWYSAQPSPVYMTVIVTSG